MMIKRIVTLAALAAGTVLLTACNATDSVSDARQDTSTSSATDTSVRSVTGDGEIQPVDCGEVQVDGGTHTLTADPTAGSIVGCTEAFNVLDEYLKIPVEQRGASLDNIQLSNGWSCGADDGETATIGCVKGQRVGDDYELAFHTTPR